MSIDVVSGKEVTIESADRFPLVNTVRVRENGPLVIEAQLQLKGVAQASPHAELCRCGQSQNKPFCDDSHVVAGFTATGEPATVPFAALAVCNGPLNVLPIPNGPLRLVGNLEVVSDTGRTCNQLTGAFLCRCGHSGNKPYCDGTHKKIGFVAA
ncbi:MAG: CDGSH iron-sulfur domain-containing protein [Burkholderiaceae bacterium]|nr:CDGSH iron-sulfur domain-containing protein [Burkholderiaceae bacterium]